MQAKGGKKQIHRPKRSDRTVYLQYPFLEFH